MKRFTMMCAVLVVAATAGCGQYAFFRDPGEQLAINRAYDAEVRARQGMPSAVGATTGSGSGAVQGEYWRY